MMKTLATLGIALPLALSAQSIHIIDVGGYGNDTPLPYYSPNAITIPMGDVIRWSNSSGTHNVNGTAPLFPDNPEGFYSGEPANGTWTYSVTFTIPGIYHYQCDSKGHADTQTGTIIVESTEGIGEPFGLSAIVVFPSPATDELKADVASRNIVRAEIIGMDGRMVSDPHFTNTDVLRIPVSELAAGNYLLRLTESNGTSTSLRFSKK
jgi:plastocyanin